MSRDYQFNKDCDKVTLTKKPSAFVIGVDFENGRHESFNMVKDIVIQGNINGHFNVALLIVDAEITHLHNTYGRKLRVSIYRENNIRKAFIQGN